MSTKTEEEDDRGITIRQILSRRGSSLTSELLAIQRHVEPVGKALRWNPRCLLYRRSSPTCFRLIFNRELRQKFIAISWTWKPSVYEHQDHGRYSFTSPTSGHRKQLIKVRNVVFDRIVKYLESVNVNIFWIDAVCIDQSSDARKARAMNSMDLVYRNAEKSLGLLTTPMHTRKELLLMQLLLSGQLCCKQRDSRYAFQRGTDYDDIIAIIRILHDLTTDPWWTRAWIFQEDYLSGMRMDLLIPVAPGVDDTLDLSPIRGEFCVSASDLRKHATVFILAYQSTNWRSYRAYCDRILGILGKYNILLAGSDDSLVCMSAKILADIGDRDVTVPWDVLAITANACGYDRRLNKSPLEKEKRSLSLCLLALFLLNGEILRTCLDSYENGNDPFNANIATFVKQASLRDDSAYNASRQLSFFKNCRAPLVRFCHKGIQISGHLWELRNEDRVHTRSLPMVRERHSGYLEEQEEWQEQGLTALAVELERKHSSLSSRLFNYIEKRRNGANSPALGYMDRMAGNLITAMDRGYVLRIGYLKEGGAGAIFIPNRDDIFEPMHAFTAWKPGASDITDLDNFVSLKVDVKANRTLHVKNWMNGLAFFQGIEPDPAILAWPSRWNGRLST